MKRPQRFVFLIVLVLAFIWASRFGIGTLTLEVGMGVFLILTAFTAFSRATVTMRQLETS